MIIENSTNHNHPSLSHVEPVLAVKDISETISHWQNVLGFPNQWKWGNPPVHGGVSWSGSSFIQFSLDPERAEKSINNMLWIRVRQIEKLLELHQKNGANIVSPLETKPWNSSEYVVKENNGYLLVFAAPAVAEVKPDSKTLPGKARLVHRVLTMDETRQLSVSVGWNAPESNVEPSTILGVVAEDVTTGQAVGCAFLVGDNQSIYYIKNVIVHPDWQRHGLGTALMKEIMNWLDQHAPHKATVGLFTGEHLAKFYGQFGFTQACGMYKQISRK